MPWLRQIATSHPAESEEAHRQDIERNASVASGGDEINPESRRLDVLDDARVRVETIESYSSFSVNEKMWEKAFSLLSPRRVFFMCSEKI